MRPLPRVSFVLALSVHALLGSSPAAAQDVVKLAFFNIQSGKGEPGLSGRPVLFADTQNCTDRTQPVNAWGVGFTQAAITSALRDDPTILALGLAEAWVCGSAENVRKLLGWPAKSSTRNGVAVVARYGFAGPEVWQQLDTSLNPTPSDTMWVLRIPVCADATCSRSMLIYAAHWYGTGTYKKTMYDRQAQQTVDFMRATAGNEPHVLIGDLNAWEGTTAQCGQKPINAGIPRLREARYVDAWPRVHGTAEGFTGMTNRSGCGQPEGYTWKRIDYAWSSPGLEPLDIERFAVPEVIGDAAASDHYGIITSYPAPGSDEPSDTTAPAVDLLTPAPGTVVAGGMVVDVAASDDTGVVRVEILEDGSVRHTLSASPYRITCDTTSHPDGERTLQARAYDAAGHASTSALHRVEIRNTAPAAIPPPGGVAEIVLHARRGTPSGAWKVVNVDGAAGGAAMVNPNAGAAKLTGARANPVDYFELTLTPAAGRAYRLWVRGRAEKDSWANDSVFVQFSGSLTSQGAPVFRIGTTSSATVNLEDAASAGLAGWGWQDNGYGTSVLGALLYFDGRPQTIRVQTREDGMTIDQIVLSPADYLQDAPGTLMHDSTILPETVAAAAPVTRDEIVVRASSPAGMGGSWKLVTDSSAADGVALAHPDAGSGKLAGALASPVHYVELTFEADAGRPYRLWLRGRADRDSWANDSVFVQFSGAVDGGGRPVHRIGTTGATVINLEDGRGAGLSGWGWQDNGYGVGVLGELITFAVSGPQTIRIQTREDGLRFDQVVLSSVSYITAAPGSLKNDATILP